MGVRGGVLVVAAAVAAAATSAARVDRDPALRRQQQATTDCVVSSLCEHCTPDELTHETRARGARAAGRRPRAADRPSARRRYCFKTGRRVELTCPRFGDPANGVAVRYEACDRTARDDAAAVYRFETWMVVVGVAALAVVRKRKLRRQSLYDKRARARDDGFL